MTMELCGIGGEVPQTNGPWTCEKCGKEYTGRIFVRCGREPKPKKLPPVPKPRSLPPPEQHDPEGLEEVAKKLGLVEKWQNYKQALRRWQAAGYPIRTREEVHYLYETYCNPEPVPCKYFDGYDCVKCGCRINKSSIPVFNKLKMATERCPVGKFKAGVAFTAKRREAPVVVEKRKPKDRPDDRPDILLPARLGFVTPGLALGGAERWIVSLCKHFNPEKFQVVGVAAVKNAFDPILHRELNEICPVRYGVNGAKELSEECEILITWGLKSIHDFVKGYPGYLIDVAHSENPHTFRAHKDSPDLADGLASVSQAAAVQFQGREEVTVVRNGIDADRCEITVEPEGMRENWGADPGEVLVGYLGRMAMTKSPLAVASAVRFLGKPYRAVYAGTGRDEDLIRKKATKLCPDCIHHGREERVGNVLHALDCFVLASPIEGMSQTLCEAWYCGCPTVATPVGAVPELEKDHGQMTVRIPVEVSDRRVAKAVKQALSQENYGVVKNAEKVVKEHYTADKMALRWEEYLMKVIR